LTPALANDSFFKVGNYARGNLYQGEKKLHLIGKSVFLTTQQERFSTGGTYPQNGPNIKSSLGLGKIYKMKSKTFNTSSFCSS